jgi:aminoglycoside phosphotransferase (APT) family kinase protein
VSDARARWREELEEHTCSLPLAEAEHLMQVMRGSRAAWLPLVAEPAEPPGSALLVGDALSGTALALAHWGYRVTVLCPASEPADRERAARRDTALARGDATFPGRLEDERFDLVVVEEGLPAPPLPGLDELARRADGNLVLVADNRLAYKRSSGKRADFRVVRPLEFARAALLGRGNERTLRGYRNGLRAAGLDRTRALALYPDRRDFSLVVAIDEPAPRLLLGPLERKNRAKIVGERAGLFSLLTPSFAVAGSRGERNTWLARALDEVASLTGEPRPEPEHLLATRGQSALVLTRAGADGAPGNWCVRVPLGPHQTEETARNAAMLRELHGAHAALPVPELLFEGQVAGVRLTVERRLPGLGAPQLSGRRSVLARLWSDAARRLATLAAGPPAMVTGARFDALVGARFERTLARARVPSTVRNLERMRDQVRERLVGLAVPPVLEHGDLRAKHLMAGADGTITGVVDWSTATREGLPWFDLFHLIAHDRKQEEGRTPGDAWRGLLERPRDEERAPLDALAEALALPREYTETLEAIYPVLVAGIAEAAWDYSRPRWLHRAFGV